MAELATIARPYAEAAFALARQRDELAKWSEMLSLMVSVYDDPEFQSAIGAPSVTNDDVERLMLAICGERMVDAGNLRRAH
jgi:F-type H+-transporting ATPase subunit delta